MPELHLQEKHTGQFTVAHSVLVAPNIVLVVELSSEVLRCLQRTFLAAVRGSGETLVLGGVVDDTAQAVFVLLDEQAV